MDVTQLLEPVLGQGIRSTNFFNGRVLTAEDLRTEQEASRSHHRQLAAALGEGVIHGLEVSRGEPIDGTPVLRIQPGLGLNRDGDAVALRRRVDLRLVTRETDVPPEAGLFALCAVPDPPIQLTNVGLYVISVRPASGFSAERAPMTELGAEGVATGCGSRWAVEGVRFSVAPLPLAPAGEAPTALASELGALAGEVESDVELVRRGGAADTPEVRLRLARRLSRLRNGAAHLCFGTDRARRRIAAPFPSEPHFPDPRYGALDGMRAREELGSCDLPLALFYLSDRGVEWVDGWSVRRVPVPALTAGSLPVLPSRRRDAETLALVLQFQQQLRDLTLSDMTSAQLGAAAAGDFFRYLPPLGFVPVQGAGVSRAFLASSFFDAVRAGGPVRIPGDRLAGLVEEALNGPPLDLDADGGVELFRLDENFASGTSAPAPYVVFVNRDAQGLPARGPVAAVLHGAWSAYRGLLRRGTFIPLEAGPDNARARVAVPAAVQAVMGGALQYATLAAARRLPTVDALDGFEALHRLQLEVTGLLVDGMTGVPDTQDRLGFATQLRVFLNDVLPAGGPGLGPAVEARDLAAAVAAQEVINHMVGTWSGEMHIIDFEPPNEQAIGQLLTVNGLNFAFPPSENMVTVGGEPVEEFRPGSNDSRLVFVVPEVPDVGVGLDVTIRIEFGEAVVEADYHVLPAGDVEGNPPSIETVLRDDGSSTLRVGDTAVITGADFGADPEAVSIELRHRPSGERVGVPAEDITLVDPTVIQFTIPELEMLPPFLADPFDLELTVGDHPAAIHGISIRRSFPA